MVELYSQIYFWWLFFIALWLYQMISFDKKNEWILCI